MLSVSPAARQACSQPPSASRRGRVLSRPGTCPAPASPAARSCWRHTSAPAPDAAPPAPAYSTLTALAAVTGTTRLSEMTRPICQPVVRQGQRYRPLNPWSAQDGALLEAISRGEFAIMDCATGICTASSILARLAVQRSDAAAAGPPPASSGYCAPIDCSGKCLVRTVMFSPPRGARSPPPYWLHGKQMWTS